MLHSYTLYGNAISYAPVSSGFTFRVSFFVRLSYPSVIIFCFLIVFAIFIYPCPRVGQVFVSKHARHAKPFLYILLAIWNMLIQESVVFLHLPKPLRGAFSQAGLKRFMESVSHGVFLVIRFCNGSSSSPFVPNWNKFENGFVPNQLRRDQNLKSHLGKSCTIAVFEECLNMRIYARQGFQHITNAIYKWIQWILCGRWSVRFGAWLTTLKMLTFIN